MTKKKNHRKFISGAMATCLALDILGGGGTYYSKAYAVSSIVSLDVNPSIELRVNSREKILDCNPLNDEAVAILADMDGGKDLKGVDLGVAVSALIGAPGMPIGKNAAADIVLADSGLNSAGAHIEVDSDIDDIPAHYDVEVEYAGVEYEYKIDAYTGAIIEKKTGSHNGHETIVVNPTPEKTNEIGLESAKAIALKHAGVSAENAVFTKSEIDHDDGVIEYEFEFISGNIEYECKVNASGTVIKFETEAVDHDDDHHKGNVSTTGIGEEAAKSTAFKHAGVDAAKVYELEVERDIDDGRLEYEIEFKCGNMEYEYKIDGATGTILEHEADYYDWPAKKDPAAGLRIVRRWICIFYSFSQTALQRFRLNAMP